MKASYLKYDFHVKIRLTKPFTITVFQVSLKVPINSYIQHELIKQQEAEKNIFFFIFLIKVERKLGIECINLRALSSACAPILFNSLFAVKIN
jgi:hypothetical protein